MPASKQTGEFVRWLLAMGNQHKRAASLVPPPSACPADRMAAAQATLRRAMMQQVAERRKVLSVLDEMSENF